MTENYIHSPNDGLRLHGIAQIETARDALRVHGIGTMALQLTEAVYTLSVRAAKAPESANSSIYVADPTLKQDTLMALDAHLGEELTDDERIRTSELRRILRGETDDE